MKPLIICAAVTGGGPAKAKTPHHPTTPTEVAAAAVSCWRAGAAMIHFHARLEDGSTTMDVNAYRNIVERIRHAGCDAILNLSAGDNGGRANHQERLEVATVGAEVVSLDAGSFNIADRIYNNSPTYLRAMAQRMKDARITPEMEVFDVGNLSEINALIAAGMITAPYSIQLVFGVPGGMPLDARLLPILIDRLPPGSEWSISCQTGDPAIYRRFMMQAFIEDGHVRTGMEDHVFLRDGELARDNAEMVEQWVQTAAIWGRPVASPAQARALLGIHSAHLAPSPSTADAVR
jgi:3-keto-5-aminohexanoate cleavage enzyme